MKYLLSIAIIGLSLSLACCSHGSGKVPVSIEDSLRAATQNNYQAHLLELGHLREHLSGPPQGHGDGAVTRGAKFTTQKMDDATVLITAEYEKLNARLEQAQKDSTTIYGALLTRFRLLKSQHKYMTATYTDDAQLLRYSSEITVDDKHETDRSFYFNNGRLVYFHERQTSTNSDQQDIMTDDSYFLTDSLVAYSYRDEGTAPEIRDKMNIMSIKRYYLSGDLSGHVGREFDKFKSDYEILLAQSLEPLLYPGKPTP
jgi:hypothetical protein